MKNILGTSPITTIIGMAIAALMIIQEETTAGETDTKQIVVAILIALLGRVVKDSDGITSGKANRVVKRVLPDKTDVGNL